MIFRPALIVVLAATAGSCASLGAGDRARIDDAVRRAEAALQLAAQAGDTAEQALILARAATTTAEIARQSAEQTAGVAGQAAANAAAAREAADRLRRNTSRQ